MLSLLAAPAKCLHWCALNKTLRCHSTRDSQKIYVTFMTFTFRKGYKAMEFSGSRGNSAHLCNDMGWIPVIGKLYKIWTLLFPPVCEIMTEAAALLYPLVWKSVTDGCHLACSQGSNVIVTIVCLLPIDWTCCRLYEWQIWGQQDHICRLSLWWQLFAYFVSIFILLLEKIFCIHTFSSFS